MVKVVDIIARLDELLRPADFEDLGPNGLQVPGRPEVVRVVTGVTATRALIDRAIELEAGLVLAHHGLFWDFHPRGLTPVLAERLRPLFKHDVNLAAYHLPLDAHPEVGNNALLAEALGCASHEAFDGIGRAGTFAGDGIALDELLARVERVTGRAPLAQGGGPARVRRIGIVSGAAAGSLPAAAAAGLDAFLTGEPREHVMGEAAESGIHFVAAGHYATETFGVRRLGELLERELGVEHVFVDLPNPV
ncbi:MAG TPA: Nif3-like dinuclear metal center hexameric protein [Solirubrobacteraceae bacterium]|nr:Nif3-like dinuclear metal center hexameric protein [Solirubrobacteraceae bacterium]